MPTPAEVLKGRWREAEAYEPLRTWAMRTARFGPRGTRHAARRWLERKGIDWRGGARS